MEIKDVLASLQRRGFEVFFTNTVNETRSLLLELIKGSDSVGSGGSATLDEVGILDELKERGNRVFTRRLMPDTNPNEVMQKALFADWFLLSANALTEDGEIVNTDGNCNRIAGEVYGGPNTVFVIGTNKIVPSLQDAFNRINTVAAKKNCLRFGYLNNPCVSGESCKNCPPETCICSTTTIMHMPPMHKKVYVIIVNKELGF